MITIKTIWLYAAILAALMTGAGAGYVAAPSDVPELERARRQLEQIEKNCIQQKKRETFRDAPVIHSPSRDF